MAKDAYYFSHDSNARNDVRMIKLKRMGGLESIGLFWCVVEMLREAENYELPIDTIEDICYEMRCDIAKFELLFICEVLIQNDTHFYSNSLKNRMVRLDEIKEKRSIAGQLGGKSKAKGKQKLSNKSRVKYSKEDNSKEKEIEDRKEEDLIFPFETIEFKKWWDLWKEYKFKDHKFKYKSNISEQAALKKLSELSGADESIAIKIIEQSMAQGWVGFFELKKNNQITASSIANDLEEIRKKKEAGFYKR